MPRPPGITQVQRDDIPLNDDGTLDVWLIWAEIKSPLAREYLKVIALNPNMAIYRGVALAGGRNRQGAVTRSRWKISYPGFLELEEQLRTSPHFAAMFLAELALPVAISRAIEVLNDPAADERNRTSASRTVVAAAQSRRQTITPAKPNQRWGVVRDWREQYMGPRLVEDAPR